MNSKFRIAIERHDGSTVYLKPGGSAERDLMVAVSTILKSQGKRLRTTDDCIKAWEAAYQTAVMELKSDIFPVI